MTIQYTFKRALLFASLLLLSQCAPPLSVSHRSEYLKVDEGITPDRKMEMFVAPYKEKLEGEMNAVIGESVKELSKEGKGETVLGNFVADLQKEFAEEIFGYPIDISIINNGGLRNILPKGNITLGNIFELSPFENFLTVLELSADDVEKLAVYAVEKKNLGINGMHIESKNNQLTEFTVNGQPVEKARVYLLAVNDYLANGGDQMEFLVDLHRKEESDILLREIILTKIKDKTAKGLRIDANIEGRQILN